MYLSGAAAVASLMSIAAFEILMGLALVAIFLTRTEWRWPPITLPILAWIGLTVVSLLVNGHDREGFPQLKKFYVYLMLFLVASTFRTARQLRGLLMGCAAAAVLSGSWGLVQFARKYMAAKAAHVNFYDYYVGERIKGFMDHWMTLSAEMMIVLLLIGAFLFFGSNLLDRVWLIPAGVVISAALLAAYTRSMWPGTAAGALYLTWFWRRWMVLAVPAVAGLLLLANPFELRDRVFSTFHAHPGNLDSNEHRHVLQEVGWAMVKAHPFFGIGPDEPKYQYQLYLPADAPNPLPKEWYMEHLHNIYFQYAADRGVPGLMALLWILGRALYDFWTGLRRIPASQRWILHAGIAIILAIMISGWGEVNIGHSNVLALFMAVLGAGYGVIRPEVTPPLTGRGLTR